MRRRDFLPLLGALACAWPLTGRTQQKTMPVIGYLASATPEVNVRLLPAFLGGLSETGWIDGQNVAIEYRWAEDRYDRLPGLAAELVSRDVEVIVSSGDTPGVLAAKNASSTIPIVFITGDDPVKQGLVKSLARQGGNLTGVTLFIVELTAKRLEMLSELVPQARVVALLVNPNNPATEPIIRNVQEAASAKSLQLHVLKGGTASEIDVAFATFVRQRVGALIVGSDPFFHSRRDQLVALAERHAVPAVYERREFALAGGLISYGPSFTGIWHQVGIYARKILKGAKPADLPVEQPTRFELVVNLKTAKELGRTVPPSILARADEVID
jgi:putative tryptophan/tyrosine transport system substrate-binding protein